MHRLMAYAIEKVASFRHASPKICVALLCERITATPDIAKAPEERQLDVLKITLLPKEEEAKPRRIAMRTG